MVVSAAAAMHGLGVQQCAYLVQRTADCTVRAAIDRRPALGGVVKPQDHPHRGRLAGSVRSEEPRDQAGPDRKRQVIDRHCRAEVLAEIANLDHGSCFRFGTPPTRLTMLAAASPSNRGDPWPDPDVSRGAA